LSQFTKSIFEIHKDENKQDFYKENAGKISWSKDLDAWICSAPEKIKSILHDKDFIVTSYEVDSFKTKLGLDFKNTKIVIGYFPLANEGEAHLRLKKQVMAQVAKNFDLCLNIFSSQLEEHISTFFTSRETLDLMQDILVPTVNSSLLALFDIKLNGSYKKDMGFSQVLDKFVSVKRRIEIENDLTEFLASMEDNVSLEQKHYNVAQFIIGYDGFLSSLSNAIYYTLSNNQEKKLSAILWQENMPVTGIPYLVRIASKDKLFDGEKIIKGQVMRLYVDSAAFQNSDTPHFSELFFGYGMHKCVGTQISKKLWEIFIKKIITIDKKFIIKSANYRKDDYVFLKYQNIILETYE
jgi:cytochrome P450